MTLKDRIEIASPLLLGAIVMIAFAYASGIHWLPVLCGVIYAVGFALIVAGRS